MRVPGRETAMALLMPVSIVPTELCDDVFYLLLCAGNLVPEDLEESCEEPARRTQIYQFHGHRMSSQQT